ncbi:MAG: riboflavin synthase [Acetobacteraceae bacterium]
MFTGIVEDIGRVRSLKTCTDTRIEIATALPVETFVLGASVACSGACLTAIEKGSGWFAVQASPETLARTTLGRWRVGATVNLERALKLGDELGGHLVSGHVDGLARVRSARPEGREGGSTVFVLEAPVELAPYIAATGSVTLDGVSLTVNAVDGSAFSINVIPHTLAVTTFGALTAGAEVNLEIDLLARYVARLLGRS